MQPLHYDLRCPAAKDSRTTHAAAAPSNLDAAITMRYRDIEMQDTIELRAMMWEIFLVHNDNRNCSSKTGSRRQSEKTTISKHFLKGILKGKSPVPKLRKSADKSLSQPWCSHSITNYVVQPQKTTLSIRYWLQSIGKISYFCGDLKSIENILISELKKSMEKTGFQRSKSIENLCIFHLFLFCPLLWCFYWFQKWDSGVKHLCLEPFARVCGQTILQGQASSSSMMSNAEGSLVYETLVKVVCGDVYYLI